MFYTPLRRDPLIIGWVVVMLIAACVALDTNTTWSGHLESRRVALFLADTLVAFLCSLAVVLFLAWLRSLSWDVPVTGLRGPRRGEARHRSPARPVSPLPWTDRWLRDWREADAHPQPAPQATAALSTACRHGAPLDEAGPDGFPPVLRSLAVSHAIVRPGSGVSVTWCFGGCTDVVVDGRPGYPACGEAVVPIVQSRRIEVVGRNRSGATPVGTATVVAMAAPQLYLPTPSAPPPIVLRTDVSAALTPVTPITGRLDEFWSVRDGARPAASGGPSSGGLGLVGVPASVTARLRDAFRTTGGGEQ